LNICFRYQKNAAQSIILLDFPAILCYNLSMENIVSATDFQAQIIQLHKENSELKNAVAELTALVEHYKELWGLAQKHRFGVSSEKGMPGGEQLTLFGETEDTLPAAVQPETEEISYTRKKRRTGKRETDLSALPLETVDYEIPEAERGCPECGETMREIGVDIRDEIKIVPATVIHVQHRRKVYKCAACDKNVGKTPILKAKSPEPPIKGSAASASAIAYIMSQKYLMHLPLYRREKALERQGVYSNRQNMANWAIKVCQDWLEPIYERLKRHLLSQNVLHSDDTGVQVLREPGKPPQGKSAMWLYRTSGCSETPVAIYEYQPDRGAEHPKNFLDGWSGLLHTDGFAGYHSIDNITVVGCWAHVRRKFYEAFQIAKDPDTPAGIGKSFCDRLFKLERKFAKMTPQERFEARLKQSKPLAGEFFAWAKAVKVPPGLAISRAITYLLNQREWLMNVYLDGRTEISNNRGERSVKPFVMGRKNWLFCASVPGVKASAIAFSLIETARENGLKPFEYLKFLLETLPNTTTNHLDGMMPWSDTLPPECKMPQKEDSSDAETERD
jgi:transposase